MSVLINDMLQTHFVVLSNQGFHATGGVQIEWSRRAGRKARGEGLGMIRFRRESHR